MINAPQIVLDSLASDSVSYANLITINLGDAYGSGADTILHYTDYGHSISFAGNTFTPNNSLSELSGISRKASTGSDAVDIVFGITDEDIVSAISSERYINKPTVIERVVMSDGVVVGDFAIPVRTAWGLSHSISGDQDERQITLTIDSSLGDLDGDNGWYAINASHEQRYSGDKIMRHSQTVMTEDQQNKYTTNFNGVINSQVKPPALSKIYGYKNAELIPVCMLNHRKTHTTYRHYFTTFVYVIAIGDCESVDISNLRKGDEKFKPTLVTGTNSNVGGWSMKVRTPAQNNTSVIDDPYLNFFKQRMDTQELARLNGMKGRGLTLLFLVNRNRDDYLTSAPKLTVPVKGAKVLDPRTGQTSFTRNPALQYSDFLRSTEYGAGKRGIEISDNNISEMANHFDQIPDSIGNDGINSVLIDVQIDTSNPIVDNMNVWMEGVRLYTSDYYGLFNLRVETKKSVDWVLDENDLLEVPDFESGSFTDRFNQLTYTIKQLVPDVSEDAVTGDLVEVDVEATFPADGTQIHTDWLAEDGGIVSFESEQLDYVTELEQAYYWAMVDARISRQPRTLKIKVGEEYWLSEVGDVISFSSTIMGTTDQLWRIDEVAEEEGDVELTLVAYSDSFYTPDPDVIPNPTAIANPVVNAQLSAVSDLDVINKDGLYYLSWTPLASANVSFYAVEITRDNVIVYDDPKVSAPTYLLTSLISGDYSATVTAVGINDEGVESTLSFQIALPTAPTLSVTSGSFDAEIIPSVTDNFLGTTFELRSSNENNFDGSIDRGTSTQFTLINLFPSITYFLWARTVNAVGVSTWTSAIPFTTNDGQGIKDLVGEHSYQYTWTVYSDKNDGTSALFATNDQDYKYQGVKNNQNLEQPANLSDQQVLFYEYSWLQITSSPTDIFGTEDMAILDSLMSGDKFDGSSFGAFADLDTVDLSDSLVVTGALTSEYIASVKLSVIDANVGTLTGATIQTSDSDSGLPRVVLNSSSTPMQMFNSTGNLVFGMDTDGQPFFNGGLESQSVEFGMLSSDAIQKLTPEVIGSTGGSDSTNGAAISTSSLEISRTLVIPEANAGSVTISTGFSDNKPEEYSASNPMVSRPKWRIKIRRKVNDGAWSWVPDYTSPAKVFEGSSVNYMEQGGSYSSAFNIHVNDSFVDEGHGATSGDLLTYEIIVEHVSGSYLAPKLTGCSIAQQLSGGGIAGAATTLDGEDGSYYLDYNNFTNIPADQNTWRGISNSVESSSSSVSASSLAVKAAYDKAVDALPKTGGTLTGNLVVQDSEVHIGNVSGDNWTKVKHSATDAGVDNYGFALQHNNASVIVNEQGSTNEALILGDVDADNDNSGLFGISHKVSSGNWIPKLDLKGDGDLYIGSSAQHKVLTSDNFDGEKGSYYLDYNNLTNVPADQDTWRGISSSVNSTSTSVSASSKAVKTAYDLAASIVATVSIPSITSTTVVDETIELIIGLSASAGVDHYEVWSDGASSDYSLIARISEEDIAASMSVIDASFDSSGTISYRVYAIRKGVYSTAATTTQNFAMPVLDVGNLSVVPDLSVYHIQYNLPESRFLDHVEIYVDIEASLGSLSRSGATLIYSGNNRQFVYSISNSDLDNYHQFWVEAIT